MKQIYIFFLATIILTSCATNNSSLISQENVGSSFQFAEYSLGGPPTQIVDVMLEPEGIYAIDKDVVFIFGEIRNLPDGIDRTFILRTVDNGRTWVEVAIPEMNYVVHHLSFVDGGYGWALAVFESNDICCPKLFRTTDNGETWSDGSMSIEMNATESFYPIGIKFTDKNTGTITFMDVMAIPRDRIGILSTTDGGLSWKETFSLTIPYDKDFDNFPAILFEMENEYSDVPGGYYGNHWRKRGSDETFHATGHDGSEWHLYYHEMSEEFILLWRQSKNSSWDVASTIPEEFVYKDGVISKP